MDKAATKSQKGKNNRAEQVVHYLVVSLLAFAIVGFYVLIAFKLPIFSPVKDAIDDYSMTDFFYRVLEETSTPDTSNVVTIVDMTELIDRADLADCLMQIEACQPKAIGIDMVFEGLKPENPEGDELIMVAAEAVAPHAVFSFKLLDDSYNGERFTEGIHSFFRDSVGIHEGYANMFHSLYGGMRRELSIAQNYKGEMRPSLIKAVADTYAGREVMPNKEHNLKINFAPKAFRVVDADSVAYYSDWLSDRVVLFGCMNDGVDQHVTPVGKIAGVKLLAYGVETLLKQEEVKEVTGWPLWLLSLLVVFLNKAILDQYDLFVKKRKSPFTRIMLSSTLVKSFVKFIWMSLVMVSTFILFSHYFISVNLTVALSAVAFSGSAENFYQACKGYIESKKS